MSSKNDVSHLVGRTLVPFFIPGTEQENTAHIVPSDGTDFGVDSNIVVRKFVDGYFVPSHTLGSEGKETGSLPPKPKTKPSSSKKMRPVKPHSITGETHYAGAAFCHSPSPDTIPLPQFLASNSPSNPSSPTQTSARAPATASASINDALSQGLLRLLRGEDQKTSSSPSSSSPTPRATSAPSLIFMTEHGIQEIPLAAQN